MRITNDRRRKPRARLGGRALVRDGSQTIACECLDLAATGIGVRAPTKVKKGKGVEVSFTLVGRTLVLAASVARCRAAGREWELGLKFTSLDVQTATMLETFVTSAASRDVRLFQAHVFLARTGARSLDDVLGTKGAFTAPKSELPTAEPEKPPSAEPRRTVPAPSASPSPTRTVPAPSRTRPPALSELQAELASATSLDVRAAKGGTVVAPNPLESQPSRVATAPPPGASEPAPPRRFTTDVSALDLDDGRGSDPPIPPSVPRHTAPPTRSIAARPPAIRITRVQGSSADFSPDVSHLDLDDSPTQLFEAPASREPQPRPRTPPFASNRLARPARPVHDETIPTATPPSPFANGPAMASASPSSMATMPGAPEPTYPASGQSPLTTPTQTTIPGRGLLAAAALRGGTQIAIESPGQRVTTEIATGDQLADRTHPTPLPFANDDDGDAMPPSPFLARGSRGAPPSPFQSAGVPSVRADDPTAPLDPRTPPDADEAEKTLASPPRGAQDTIEQSVAPRRPDSSEQGENDEHFTSQYSRALAELDLESR